MRIASSASASVSPSAVLVWTKRSFDKLAVSRSSRMTYDETGCSRSHAWISLARDAYSASSAEVRSLFLLWCVAPGVAPMTRSLTPCLERMYAM